MKIDSCYILKLQFQGGVYLLQLMDWYSCSFGLLFGAALEAIMIGWMYGKNNNK